MYTFPSSELELAESEFGRLFVAVRTATQLVYQSNILRLAELSFVCPLSSTQIVG